MYRTDQINKYLLETKVDTQITKLLHDDVFNNFRNSYDY